MGYVLDLTEPPRTGKLTVEIDRDNVFEESPTAIVFKIEGEPYRHHGQAALDVGPVRIELDGVRADATLAVTMDEAEAIHAALGAMIAEVRC